MKSILFLLHSVIFFMSYTLAFGADTPIQIRFEYYSCPTENADDPKCQPKYLDTKVVTIDPYAARTQFPKQVFSFRQLKFTVYAQFEIVTRSTYK